MSLTKYMNIREFHKNLIVAILTGGPRTTEEIEKELNAILQTLSELVKEKEKILYHEKYMGRERHVTNCPGCAQEDVLDDLLSGLKGKGK